MPCTVQQLYMNIVVHALHSAAVIREYCKRMLVFGILISENDISNNYLSYLLKKNVFYYFLKSRLNIILISNYLKFAAPSAVRTLYILSPLI